MVLLLIQGVFFIDIICSFILYIKNGYFILFEVTGKKDLLMNKKTAVIGLLLTSSMILTSCKISNNNEDKNYTINNDFSTESSNMSSNVSYDTLMLKADTCSDIYESEKYYLDAIKKDRSRSDAYYKLLTLYIEEKNIMKSTDLINQIDKNVKKPSEDLKALVSNEKSKHWYAVSVNTKGVDGTFFESNIEYDTSGRLYKSCVPLLPDYNYGFASADKYYIYTYSEKSLIIQTEYTGNGIKTHSVGYKLDSNGLITYFCKYDNNGNIVNEITIEDKQQRNSVTNNSELLQFEDSTGIFWRVLTKKNGMSIVTHTINSSYDSMGNLMNTLCTNVNTNKTMYMEFNYVYCTAEQLLNGSSEYEEMPHSNSDNPQ